MNIDNLKLSSQEKEQLKNLSYLVFNKSFRVGRGPLKLSTQKEFTDFCRYATDIDKAENKNMLQMLSNSNNLDTCLKNMISYNNKEVIL